MRTEDITTVIRPGWTTEAGAGAGALAALEGALGAALPEAYRLLLSHTNGGEGWIGQVYLSLWSASEALSLNRDYRVRDYLPHVWGIGTDGGDRCCGLDFSTKPDPQFVRVPLGDLHPSSVQITTSFGPDFWSAINSPQIPCGP